MIARRRTARVAFRLTGRWLRRDGSQTIEISDISAHGLFLCDRLDMPLGQLQQLEIDLPVGTVRLLVIPRHAARSEWTHGLGLEIFAASTIDRNLWLTCFRDVTSAARTPSSRAVRTPRAARS